MPFPSGIRLSVPSYSLQGADIPFYILWNKERQLQISIQTPDGTQVKRLHNVEPKSIKVSESEVTVKEVEVNGYVGGVFSSRIYESASLTKTFKFKLKDGNTTTEMEKQVLFFRPDVKVVSSPREIKVRTDKAGKLQVENGLQLANPGPGTGIVHVTISPNSEAKEGPPKGLALFLKNFSSDLGKELELARKEFPKYSAIIGFFLDAIKNPPAKLKGSRPWLRRFSDALENNEQFRDRIIDAVLSSYMKNMQLLTDVDAFLTYLKAISTERVIVAEPLKSVRVGKTPTKLLLELEISDLAYNSYPTIKLPPITLVADTDCDVSFYQLLSSSGTAKELVAA
jgi:hypothetical protein